MRTLSLHHQADSLGVPVAEAYLDSARSSYTIRDEPECSGRRVGYDTLMNRPATRALWVLPLLAMAVLAALWLLSDDAPRMPADADHTVRQTETACLTCHGHQGRSPRPASHPLRDDCYSCHGDAAGRKHRRPGAPTELPGGWPDDPRLNPAGRRRPDRESRALHPGMPD